MEKKLYIGTSGYAYKHWENGVFYPEGQRQKERLEYYCKYMNSVELNVTFYRLPSPAAFKGWHSRTPEGFRFAIKGSRYITHIKRLKEPRKSLELFFSRTKALREKLSVVLWQLPPNFKPNIERLKQFVDKLEKIAPCRQVFEFRHSGWFCKGVYAILKKHNMALCRADWPEYSNSAPDTANFIYIRRHGQAGNLYGGCYSREQLQKDIDYIREKKKDSYVYFNNDAEGWAIKNAISLREMQAEKQKKQVC